MSDKFTGKRRMWPTPNAMDAASVAEMTPEAWFARNAKKKAENPKLGELHLHLGTAAMMTATDWDHFAPIASPQLTLWPEGFPANPTPWLADAAALRTNATSGRSSPDSFARLDPDGCWRKTCQGYSQMTLDGSLEEYCETWPRAGMTRNGTAYQLPPLAPLTDAIASGSWPTPTVGDSKSARNSTAQRFRIPPTGIHAGDTLTDYVSMWPTPQAHNWKHGVDYSDGRRGTKHSPQLRHLHTGQLNPTWVEWLMGYPLGYTDLGDWATPSSRKLRNGSGAASSRRTNV